MRIKRYHATTVGMLCLLGFINSFSQTREQRKDSLLQTSAKTEERYQRTWYVFDSLFVINEKHLQKNIPLSRTIGQAQLVYNGQDSVVFYIKAGRTTILNERVLKEGVDYIIIDRCKRNFIKVVPSRSLKNVYGIGNPKGGYLIRCE